MADGSKPAALVTRVITLAHPVVVAAPEGVIFGAYALESPQLAFEAAVAPGDIGQPMTGGARGFLIAVAGGWYGPGRTRFDLKQPVMLAVLVDHIVASQLVDAAARPPT